MPPKRPNRSDQYQYKFWEAITDSGSLSDFAHENDISIDAKEQLAFLRDCLLTRVKVLMRRLPKRKYQALTYIYIDGYTEAETAKAMNIMQPAVNRLKNNGTSLLSKIAMKDPDIVDLLYDIQELSNEY